MGNCQICENNKYELDGEAIPDGYGGYEGCSELIHYCCKGYSKKHDTGGSNCKGFKEHEDKCIGCKKILPISLLNKGFCSVSCKEQYRNYVTEQVKENKSIVSELKNKEKLSIDEMTLLNGASYYLEEGLSTLKSLETLN